MPIDSIDLEVLHYKLMDQIIRNSSGVSLVASIAMLISR